jgi:hypothetical protein
MEKIYFPHPKHIPSLTEDVPWVVDSLRNTEAAIDKV